MEERTRLIVAVMLATLMSAYGYRKRSLNKSGAAFALLVGFVSCSASVTFGLVLIAFFIGSSRVTKIGAKKKAKIEDGHQVGGNRNWIQVLANGGVGTYLAAAYWYRTRQTGLDPELPLDFATRPAESMVQAAYLSAYACCNADTWASELGVLSKATPILVTRPWRRVPAGTNGGITTLGTMASLMGGLLIGLVYWGLSVALEPVGTPPVARWPLAVLGAATGVAGSLIDSLLGATLQYSGFCESKKLVVEKPGETVRHLSGLNVLDNHQVNFFACACTSVLGALGARACM